MGSESCEGQTCWGSDRSQVLLGRDPFHEPQLGHDEQHCAHSLVITDQQVGCIYHLCQPAVILHSLQMCMTVDTA